MHIGIAGPATPLALADLLDPDSAALAAAHPGMGGTPVNIIVRELVRRGHRVTLVTLDKTVTTPLLLRGDGLSIHVGHFRGRARDHALDFSKKERDFVRGVLNAQELDVVHAQWTYEFALGALASHHRVITTVHDAPLRILLIYRDAYRLLRFMMAVRAIRKARELIAVSPYIAAHVRHYMRYRGTFYVVPNGLPSDVFAATVRPRRQGDTIAFGTVMSGFDRLRNARSALQAFGQVRIRLPQSRLLMFGHDFSPDGAACQWAQQEGLTQGVEFRGYLPHSALIQAVRDDIDVLVHPSTEESQSMAITEAMSQGKAVIGGAGVGAVPWVLDEGRSGMLVNIRKPAEIAAAMVRLAEDEPLRIQYASAALESARARFDIRMVCDQLEQIYRGNGQTS